MSRLPTPVPPLTAETAPFWRGAAEGHLVLPRRRECRRLIWYPREFCPHCGSDSVDWERLPGLGRIYSVTVVRRAPHPDYADALPYCVALVELEDEQVRMLTNIVTDDPDSLFIGQPVDVNFDQVDDEIAVVRFRPRAAD